MTMRSKNLIIDASNLLYRTFFMYSKDKDADEILVGMCNQSALLLMNFYYKLHKPDKIIMAFDSHSWRKMYTEDLSTCVTFKKYKGNRRQKLSTSEYERLEVFDSHVEDFYNILRKQTKVITAKGKYLEADDLIAGIVQEHDMDDNIIISADKDFIQLLKNPLVTLIDPIKNLPRTLDEWGGDAELFMFEKCIRGDTSDNVQSSYPRIRKTKILDAYNDDYICLSVMEHEFDAIYMDNSNNPVEVKYATKELFNENELLMDLTKQPPVIRDIIKKKVKKSFKNIGKFDYYGFMRFCAKRDMARIVSDLDSLVPMLNNKKK